MENQATPVVYQYEDNEITFFKGESVMVNATQMAKKFGKRVPDWLNNSYAKEFIAALSETRKSVSADLVRVVKGGDPRLQGTWMHEDVALEFARWLSPKFAIWCNDRIKELLTTGVTTATNDDAMILHSIEVLQKRVAASKQQIASLQADVRKLTPDAEYTQRILAAQNTWNTNVIAKEFGMSAVTLNRHLQRLGIQYKQHGVWLLAAKYQDKGYTRTHSYDYLNSHGETCSRMQTEWTETGRKWLHSLHEGKLF